jgi:hypothetical protein
VRNGPVHVQRGVDLLVAFGADPPARARTELIGIAPIPGPAVPSYPWFGAMPAYREGAALTF